MIDLLIGRYLIHIYRQVLALHVGYIRPISGLYRQVLGRCSHLVDLQADPEVVELVGGGS